MVTDAKRIDEQAKLAEWLKTHKPVTTKQSSDKSVLSDAKEERTMAEKEKVEKVVEPAKVLSDVTFDGLTGAMGKHRYYVAMMALTDVAERLHFAEDEYEEDLPAEEKYQRKLNTRRVNESLVPYLESDGHFFPPLVATALDENDITFKDGKLTLKGTGIFPVLDGQHRLKCIQTALENAGTADADLGFEQIGVLFMPHLDVAERQQLFSDLNRNAKLPPKAVGILFDHRDICAIVSRAVADHGQLSGKVNMESSVLSKKSGNVITLGVLYEMVKSLCLSNPESKKPLVKDWLKDKSVEEVSAFVCGVFDDVILPSLPNFAPIAKGVDGAAGVARTTFICYSSLGWQAMARAIGTALDFGVTQEAIATGLQSVNWLTEAPIWKPCVMDGKIMVRKEHIRNAIAIVTAAIAPTTATKAA